MKVEIDGPFTITPADEPDDDSYSGEGAVWVFLAMVAIVGVILGIA